MCLERLGVQAKESIFLDDIGQNLKAAAQLGIKTLKVRQCCWGVLRVKNYQSLPWLTQWPIWLEYPLFLTYIVVYLPIIKTFPLCLSTWSSSLQFQLSLQLVSLVSGWGPRCSSSRVRDPPGFSSAGICSIHVPCETSHGNPQRSPPTVSWKHFWDSSRRYYKCLVFPF